MSVFLIGGTNVTFSYRWHKCHAMLLVAQMSLFIIGGTNVMLYYWWHKCHILTIGGTNDAVGEMSWWDKCQVGQMSVGQMSVAL